MNNKHAQLRRMTVALSYLLIATLAIFTFGCGGGSSTGAPGGTPAAFSAPVTVNVGDGPNDRIASFEVTVNSITLTDSAGVTVSVLNTPTRVELSHLAGTVEPLILKNLPQGAYTKATLTLSSPEVTIVDPATGVVTEKAATLASATVMVTFSPAITIGSAPTALNFDFDLAASITVDASNNVTFNPVILVKTFTRAPETEQEPEDGEVEVRGAVTSVGDTFFIVATPHVTEPVKFFVNSSTEFKEGFAGFSALKAGMLVEVEAVTQADGTLLAKKVEVRVEMADGLEAEGFVVKVTGNPVTQFDMVVHGASSPGTTRPSLGRKITVNVTANTQFRFPGDRADLSNLPFVPQFDATTLAPGQKVEADTELPNTDAITAKKVKLHPQAFTGQISNFAVASGSQATFTLTLPADGVFATVTGKNTITVFKQFGTDLRDGITVADGTQVRVRGLLFFDGVDYKMIAVRIGRP